MKYKPYSEETWTRIHEALSSAKKQNDKLVAAFDADGTLWDTDLGEQFFHYQIEHKLVPMPKDPWNYYLNLKMKNNDPREAYLWLAQINADVSLGQMYDWAQKSFEVLQPQPIFEEQRKLIQLLKHHDVKIYIVTASIRWAVEPGALALGLEREDVIGVETKVIGDKITSEGITPITYRKGKVDALLQKTKGQMPFLCSGNSMGDFELLNAATHFSLAVSAASRDDKLFKAEAELQNSASQIKNCIAHRFI